MIALTKLHHRYFSINNKRRQQAKDGLRFVATIIMLASMLLTNSGVGVTQAAPAANTVGQGFTVSPSDLAYILQQIKIAERHSRSYLGPWPTVDGQIANPNPTTDPFYCQSMVGTGPDQISSPLLSLGLRTTSGDCNNLQPSQSKYGAADQTFPRLTVPVFKTAEDSTVPGIGPVGPPGLTSYAQTGGSVVDSEPRMISNLIVDQTSTNPAAVAAAGFPVRSQGADPVVPCVVEPTTPGGHDGQPLGCVPQYQTLFIENITTDVGLSPPFNSLFTIFGQFFDHGLDKITNGGSGTVFVPLSADDPLIAGDDHILGTSDDLPPGLRFMTLTRGTNVPGTDGFRNSPNTDTPFVDQSQTYTSHASHQIFLREYVNNNLGKPVTTGKFLSSPDGDGMANWAQIKIQAATMLGIQLVDTDVNNIPMIAADPYGKFIPGPNGLPQLVTNAGLIEGNLANPVKVDCPAIGAGCPATYTGNRIDTAFLNDIAHSAGPGSANSPKTPDANHTAGGSLDPVASGEYDDELLDLHFICGDGRCNENIALTAVHQMFHSEHDRLVDDIKNVLANDTSGITSLADWQSVNGANGWNGERIFQAARFVTEMEYQHLVFEEFARKVQPAINPFQPFAFNQTDLNPAITAEFAHAVYRFGHSMLTETIARTNADGSTNDIPLFDGFLNPAEYYNGGSAGQLSSREAATAIIMGMSDQSGNEIDEFVTDVLRNHLVGLPLDLAALNMTRARSEGIPPLNAVRRQIYAATNDGQLKPYDNWIEFQQHLKHPESLVNFVAAYGTHPSLASLVTIAERRAAADQLVNGTVLPGPDGIVGDDPQTVCVGPNDPAGCDESLDDILPPADAADFMFGTGAWATTSGLATSTGLDAVDLWMGGLAENTNLFGGLLGSTFNYVFEKQLTDLQNGDRLYYLARTPGMNLRAQLEGNSFAELVMRNTNAHTLKADPFATADCKFEIGLLTFPAPFGSFITGSGSVADVTSTACNENRLLLNNNGQVRYRAINSVDPAGINGQAVYNGTNLLDRIFGGNDNDTFWGGLGNDIIDGGGGDDIVLGGLGNDIITDFGGADIPKGGPGNDAIDSGIGDDIIMSGDGKDFTNAGANINETFGGAGDDFAIAGQGEDAIFGDSGDDWEEGGDQPDLLIGDSSTLFFDDHNLPGHDILIGQGGDDDYDMEGGDDIGVGGPGVEKNAGAAGYDWLIGLGDPQPQDMDLSLPLIGIALPANGIRDRFNEVEALSGWDLNDTLRGDSIIPSQVGGGGFIGCDALDEDGVARIAGLEGLVPASIRTIDSAPIAAAASTNYCGLTGLVWGEGNILIGGAGSDKLEGRGGNDILDGDRYLNVRLSIRTDPSVAETEFASSALMETIPTSTGGSGWTGAFAGKTLQQAVFAGLVDPGNIVAVREILDPGANSDIDTAVFFGPQSDYDIVANLDGSITVTDLTIGGGGGGIGGGAGDEGTDTLWNIEQLQFCDAVDLITFTCIAPVDVPLSSILVVNTPATGTIAINNLTPTENLLLTANPVINDPNGVGTLLLSWQSEITPGNWVEVGTGPTFIPLNNAVGFPLRVVASFFDGFGALETVIGDVTNPVINVNDAPTGAPVLDSNTPDVGVTLNAATDLINDPDGVVGVTFSFQWQANGSNLPGANGSAFTPTEAERGKTLRVVVTFTDNHGTLETLISASTNPVPAPLAQVTPGVLNFGAQPTGSLSASQSITVTNVGNSSLVVTGLSFSGANAGEFPITQNTCGTVLPGDSCLINVAFLPNSIGGKSAAISLSHNAAGSPAAITLSGSGSVAATVPSTPTIGAAVQGNGNITVNWTAPASNGGSPITGYEVRVINNATNAQVGALRAAPANATSLVITGLNTGTAYRFRVRALNSVGPSNFSAPSAAVVFATLPGAPTINNVSRGANGGAITANVSWNPPGNTGGLPIVNYRAYALIMSSNNNNATVLQTLTSPLQSANARNFTFTFTQTNLNVRFQVEAINALGAGPRSARSGNVVPR